MTIAAFFGWAAAIFGAFFTMPQLVRVIRTNSTAGLSLRGWQLQSAVVIAWTMHGAIYGYLNQFLSNVVITSASLGVVFYLIRHRSLSWLRTLLPVVAVGLALSAVDLFFGQLVFGLVVLLPGSVALIEQLRELLRAPDISGVSPGFLMLGIFIQSLWFTWSLLISDIAVTITSMSLLALLAANLMVWWYRTRQARRVRNAWAGERPDTTVGP